MTTMSIAFLLLPAAILHTDSSELQEKYSVFAHVFEKNNCIVSHFNVQLHNQLEAGSPH